MKLKKKEIEIIKNYFKKQPVKKVYLFGSQARGEVTKDGDVDILLELDHSQKIGLLFVQMKLDLEDLLSKKIDLVTEAGMSKYIKPIVEQEKQLIYAR